MRRRDFIKASAAAGVLAACGGRAHRDPPTPTPVPVPEPGTMRALPNVGIRMAGALNPTENSEPVGARLPTTTLARPAQNGVVTDSQFSGVPIRGLVVGRVPWYSQLQAVSPDGQRILLVKPDGDTQMFDRTTLAQVGSLPGDALAPRWLPDGRVLYIASGDGQNYRFLTHDPVTDLTDSLYKSLYPYGRADKVHEEVSDDGAWTAALMHNGVSGSPRWAAAVNLREGRLGAQLAVDDDAVNWVRATPDGKYLAIQWNAAADNVPGPRKTGIELFDIETGVFVRQMAPQGHHGDWGRMPDGRVFYATHHQAHPANSNYPSVVLYWADGAPVTHLRMVFWGTISHISCRGPRGWIVITNQRPGTEVPDAQAEIWLMRADTGEVVRLAHHRSTSNDYWSEPHATITRDGLLIIFGSRWNGAPLQSFALELP